MNLKKLLSFGITPKDVIIVLIADIVGTGIIYFLTELIHFTDKPHLKFIGAIFAVQILIWWAIAYLTRQKVTEEQKTTLKAEYEKMIADMNLQNTKTFEDRTDAHHWFAHYARDLAIRLTGDYKKPNPYKLNLRNDVKDEVRKIVEQIYKTFKFIVPSEVKLFATIRERRGDKYHTIMRCGDVDQVKRKKNSKPLTKNNLLVKHLIQEFKHQECIMRTGIYDARWEYMKDDMHKSVLLGAVFSKRWNKEKAEFVPIRLEWIISIAANDPNALQDWHRPLMKCFNDTCGLVVNVALRHQMIDEERNPGNPAHTNQDTLDW